jgi:hypothetical protein
MQAIDEQRNILKHFISESTYSECRNIHYLHYVLKQNHKTSKEYIFFNLPTYINN